MNRKKLETGKVYLQPDVKGTADIAGKKPSTRPFRRQQRLVRRLELVELGEEGFVVNIMGAVAGK